MGEAQIVRLQEDILNEHVRRAGVVEEAAHIGVPGAVDDVRTCLTEHGAAAHCVGLGAEQQQNKER